MENRPCRRIDGGGQASTDFDEAVSPGNKREDFWQEGFEPLKKGASAGVAHAQPNDNGACLLTLLTLGKVFVFGQDNRFFGERIVPDGGVASVPEADVGDVLGGVPLALKQASQGGRKLGIDDKAHGAHRATSTGWSASEAA